MVTEKETNTEAPAEEEYVKPNPQDNPRNIALKEIAATVAKKHEVEFAETAPSIDDAGNITPAQETPPEATPPAEETPASEAAPAVTPVPAASAEAVPTAQDAIFPDKEYDAVVEGKKIRVSGKALIDAGYRTFQKETAADFRLKMASELLKEAEAKVRGATPQGAPPAESAPAPSDKTDVELANALQFGTPEQAAEAMKTLRGRGAVTPEQVQKFAADQARFAAQDELRFQDAMNFVQTEYADLLSNDYIKRLFFVEENRRRAPRERGGEADARPYKELYRAIGDDLRAAFNLPKPASSQPAAPTPPGTVQARQARKAEAPPVPRTAATRITEAAEATKVATPSEIIARMAEQRGKTHLTTLRKGT